MASKEQRATSLNGLAHIIARRFQTLSQNGNASPEVKAHHFDVLTRHTDNMRGGPVSTAEMEILAVELVPEAVAFLAARLAA
jgi:hypothetical protein